MTNILLVDDDAFYRTNFAALLDWEGLGCQIAYQADDGRQAIAILEKESVDLIITDMSMPIVNGVELIAHVKQHWPKIECLALSGFDEFLFVKESIQNGAADYILKHTVTKESLLDALSHILPKIQDGCDIVNTRSVELKKSRVMLLEIL